MGKNYYTIKNFSTKIKATIEPKGQLFGYALRDKFSSICHADLISKILNKTEDDNMLLRYNLITNIHVNKIYSVYNGYIKIKLHVKQNMVGFRVGEFVPSRKIQNLNQKTMRKIYRRILKTKIVKYCEVDKVLRSHNINAVKVITYNV